MPSQTVTIYLWPVTSTSWLLPGFWIMTIIHSTDWRKYQSILKLCMSNLTLVSLELNFFLKIQIDQRSLTSRCLQFILAYTVCITKNSLICSQPLFIMNCSVHFLIHILVALWPNHYKVMHMHPYFTFCHDISKSVDIL